MFDKHRRRVTASEMKFLRKIVGKTRSDRIKNSTIRVDPGGPVVIILASGSEVRGFKPGWGQWIFSERNNSEYDFLWKVSKAVGPVS